MERDESFIFLRQPLFCCLSFRTKVLLKFSVMSLIILSGVYVFYITLNLILIQNITDSCVNTF